MRTRHLAPLLLPLLFVAQSLMAQTSLRFVYPPPETPNDQRYAYYWDLLQAALEANKDSFGPYELKRFVTPMNADRALVEVESGKGLVNIITRGTNLDLESRLRPIPIPLDKGLVGFRLFLILKENQASLDKVQSLQDLQRFSIGQYATWTDVKILEANGFRTVPERSYEWLFHQLGAKRYPLFSRSVNEIQDEWQTHKNSIPGLAIEERLMLYYPFPRYFFVPRTEEGTRMAARIEDGLLRLRKSGEFESRYQAYKKLVLTDLKLAGRKVFKLSNPQLSDLAPSDKYWWEDLADELNPRPGTKTIPRKPERKEAE